MKSSEAHLGFTLSPVIEDIREIEEVCYNPRGTHRAWSGFENGQWGTNRESDASYERPSEIGFKPD